MIILLTENIMQDKQKHRHTSSKKKGSEEKITTIKKLIFKNEFEQLCQVINGNNTKWKSEINLLLQIACEVKKPNYNIIELLIQNKANVNQFYHEERSPLTQLVGRNQTRLSYLFNQDIISLLLKHGARINDKNKKGMTCLFFALINEIHFEDIKFLLDNNADPHVTMEDNVTTLHCATYDLKIMKLFLERGVDVNVQDSSKSTPLHFACSIGNNLMKMSESPRTMSEEQREKRFQNTPCLALFESTVYYIDYHSDIFFESSPLKDHLLLLNKLFPAKENVLEIAPVANRVQISELAGRPLVNPFEMIAFLLSQGARPEITNRDGETCLHVLIKNAQMDSREKINVIKKILSIHPSTLNQQDKQGRTPLLLECLNDNPNFVLIHLFLANGANMDIKDKNGVNSAFHVICMNHNMDPKIKFAIVNSFIQAKKSSNDKNSLALKQFLSTPDEVGDTPLHILCLEENENEACIELLVKEMAHVNVLNKQHLSALAILCRKKNPNIKLIKCLLEKGADPNIQTSISQLTPLHIIIGSNSLRNPTGSSAQLISNIVQLLVHNNANPNLVNADGFTCLHVACASPYRNVALLTREPTQVDFKQDRILVQQAQNNKWMLYWMESSCIYKKELSFDTEELLKVLPEVNHVISDQALINFLMAKNCCPPSLKKIDLLPVIEVLLTEGGANPNFLSGSSTKASSLHVAITERPQDTALIKMLLKNGANPNLREGVYNMTPCHLAAINPVKHDVMALLINYGGDVMLKVADVPPNQIEVRDVFFLACLYNHHELPTIKLLLSHYDIKNNQIVLNYLLEKLSTRVSDINYNKKHKTLACEIIKLLNENGVSLSKKNLVNEENKKEIVSKFEQHFFKAIRNHDNESIKQMLLEKKTSQTLNLLSEGLLLACSSHTPNYEFIQFLTQNKADPIFKNKEAQTSLHLCCKNKHTNHTIIEFIFNTILVKNKLICFEKDSSGYSSFDYYLENKIAIPELALRFFNLLLEFNIIEAKKLIRNSTIFFEEDKNIPFWLKKITKKEGNILHWFCKSKTMPLAVLDLYLTEMQGNPNIENHAGKTLLHLLCENPCVNKEIIDLLLNKGADPNKKDNLGRTPFMLASENEAITYEIINLLWIHDGDLLLCDNNKKTGLQALLKHKTLDLSLVRGKNGLQVLYLAIKANYHDEVERLINLNPSWIHEDLGDESLLHFACQSSMPNQKIIKLLLTHGAKTDALDKQNATPWQRLCENNHTSLKLLKLFLKKNPLLDKNIQLYEGNTLLHLAKNHMDSDFMCFLIKNGANLNAVNHADQTPLHLICKNKDPNLDLIDVFLSNGANPQLKDNQGKTAFDYLHHKENKRKKTQWREDLFFWGMCDNKLSKNETLFKPIALIIFNFLKENKVNFYLHGSSALPIPCKIFYTEAKIFQNKPCIIEQSLDDIDILIKQPLEMALFEKLIQFLQENRYSYMVEHAYLLGESSNFSKVCIECEGLKFDFYFSDSNEIRSDFIARNWFVEIVWVDVQKNNALFSLFSESAQAKQHFLTPMICCENPKDFFTDFKRIGRLFLAFRDFSNPSVDLQTAIMVMSQFYNLFDQLCQDSLENKKINIYAPYQLLLRVLSGRGAVAAFMYLLEMHVFDWWIPELGALISLQPSIKTDLKKFFKDVEEYFNKTGEKGDPAYIFMGLLQPLLNNKYDNSGVDFFEKVTIKFKIPKNITIEINKYYSQLEKVLSNVSQVYLMPRKNTSFWTSPLAKERLPWPTIHLLAAFIKGESLSHFSIEDIKSLWEFSWRPARSNRKEFESLRLKFFYALHKEIIHKDNKLTESDIEKIKFIEENVFGISTDYKLNFSSF